MQIQVISIQIQDLLKNTTRLVDNLHAMYSMDMRLVHLLPELLELVDEEKLPIMSGYELSFLDRESQRIVFEYFFCGNSKDRLTVKNAETIRAAYKTQKSITADSIYALLHKPVKKRGPVTYTFSHKALIKEYNLPDGFDLNLFLHEKLREIYGWK